MLAASMNRRADLWDSDGFSAQAQIERRSDKQLEGGNAVALNHFIRSFSLFLGITPPRPGEERRAAVILVVLLISVILFSVGLFWGMSRLILR